MNNIGDILRRLREENGLKGNEVVDRLKDLGIEISVKTLYGYESGRNSTNADMFLALCKIYKCQNIMEVFSNSVDDVLFTNKEWEIIEKYRSLDSHGKKMVDFTLNEEWDRSTIVSRKENEIISESSITTPIIRLINYYYRLASAGTGQIVFDTPPTKRIEIPDLPKYRNVDYAIGVNGNSMEPVFHDGDTLLIEMTDEIEVDEIGIFLVDNESYVKKLGKGELVSLNPEYENIKLTADSKCMGKVIDKL